MSNIACKIEDDEHRQATITINNIKFTIEVDETAKTGHAKYHRNSWVVTDDEILISQFNSNGVYTRINISLKNKHLNINISCEVTEFNFHDILSDVDNNKLLLIFNTVNGAHL